MIPIIGRWASLLEPMFYFSAKFLKFNMVYTDKEFPNRSGIFRLWWNTILEIDSDCAPHYPVMVCSNPIANMPHIQLYPVLPLSSNFDFLADHKPSLVYFGEVELTNIEEIKNAWLYWRSDLLKNFSLITDPIFWAENFSGVSLKSRFEYYSAFSNFIRYECMLALVSENIAVEIYGDQWRKIGFISHQSMWGSVERRDLYRGNLCLDFGSKSGSDSLYQRTVEIIESDGLPVCVARCDSLETYGSELASLITFNNIDDLVMVIKKLENNLEARNYSYNLLRKRFEKNMNIDISAKNSLASLLN